MKKLILLFAACITIFSSCKEEVVKPEEPQLSDVKYFFNSKEVSSSSIDMNSKDLIILHMKDGEVRVFDTDERYEDYLLQLAKEASDEHTKLMLENAVKQNQLAREISIIAEENEDSGDDVISELVSSKMAKLDDLKTANLPQAKTELAGQVVTLYKDINFTGGSKVLPGLVPSIAKDWRNKTSSFKVVKGGTLTMCDNTWFRGTKKVFVLIVYLEVPDLSVENFNDKLESMF